jgi:hypothetical protein
MRVYYIDFGLLSLIYLVRKFVRVSRGYHDEPFD